MREEVRPVKQTEALEEVARLAAREALKEHERQLRREKRIKVFQNTKKLMENYNRICQLSLIHISEPTRPHLSERGGGSGRTVRHG